jgi:hypothetical protein
MSRGLRKFALAVHLTVSVGWVGAALAYLGLGIASVTSERESTIRGAWIAMELIGWWVIVPLAISSLLTGVVMGLGTKWGLVRYYWVLVSFVLTTFATSILLLHMPDVSAIADEARVGRGAELNALGGDLFHAGIGLIVLVAVLMLNVIKPPGLTRYGWRRHASTRTSSTMEEAGRTDSFRKERR